jgi:hypothetical protein
MAPSTRSPRQDRIEQLERIVGNPFTRFAVGYTGRNPFGEELERLRTHDVRERELGVNKNLAAGKLAVDFFESVAKATPEQRQVLIDLGSHVIQPLMKSLGYDLPPSLIRTFATEPGAATKYATLFTSRLGKDRAEQLLPLISNMTDTTKIMDLLDKETERGTRQVLPSVKTRLARQADAIRGDRGLMHSLGLLDEQGRPQPLPAQVFLSVVDDAFQDPLERAAVVQVLSDDSHKSFLASVGVEPGAVQFGAMEAFRKIPAKVAEQRALIPGDVEKARLIEQAKQRVQQNKPLSHSEVNAIRGQFEQLSRNFLTVRDSFGRVVEVAEGAESPAGDLALVFSYMKMLDPQSVVREGEFATAENARGVPERVLSVYNRVVRGERLTPAQRKDFLTQAKQVFASQLKSHTELEGEFKGIAAKGQADPAVVVPDFVGRFRTLPPKGKEEKPSKAGDTPDERAKRKFLK